MVAATVAALVAHGARVACERGVPSWCGLGLKGFGAVAAAAVAVNTMHQNTSLIIDSVCY